MNINLTLFGEMITFAIFVWFTMRFVWPPLMKALEERRATIAAGLAAAEQGKRDLALAKDQALEILRDAKAQAAHLIEQAHHRVNHMIEEAKGRARIEADRLMVIAKGDIDREFQTARDVLMDQISSLVIIGAEKVLQHEVNQGANDRIVTKMIETL